MMNRSFMHCHHHRGAACAAACTSAPISLVMDTVILAVSILVILGELLIFRILT